MKFERPARRSRGIMIMPMIDILFVVLIFFIVTTQFRRPRPVLRIELPTVKEVPSATVTEASSILSVDRLGTLSLDDIRVPDIALLENYLKSFVKNNPGRKLELEADKDIPLEKLLEVWDALTRAGIPIKDVPARIRLPQEAGAAPDK
ncbi:biopolymer transporter ExbD [Haloferula sp. BvORR071]|uniref:ExbD/TolR family protein n=1 Tax=Haloferula sp. BvORR071 TaxID=1396141 RepID=UPI00054E82AD|nr:biopolymer transporter ExbD [Haloferula sp. BvORR071]